MADKVRTSPFWRSYFEERRCLVPVTSFSEPKGRQPAVGGGAMVIALAGELLSRDINYQQHLHVTAVDINIRAVHMAYVQLSLLHVPAVIIHGDTLSLEEYAHWHTTTHILGGWRFRLAADEATEPVAVAPAPARKAAVQTAAKTRKRARSSCCSERCDLFCTVSNPARAYS